MNPAMSATRPRHAKTQPSTSTSLLASASRKRFVARKSLDAISVSSATQDRTVHAPTSHPLTQAGPLSKTRSIMQMRVSPGQRVDRMMETGLPHGDSTPRRRTPALSPNATVMACTGMNLPLNASPWSCAWCGVLSQVQRWTRPCHATAVTRTKSVITTIPSGPPPTTSRNRRGRVSWTSRTALLYAPTKISRVSNSATEVIITMNLPANGSRKASADVSAMTATVFHLSKLVIAFLTQRLPISTHHGPTCGTDSNPDWTVPITLATTEQTIS